MKLVYAIIRNDNEDDVTSALMQEDCLRQVAF